jgi:hypothetical protein
LAGKKENAPDCSGASFNLIPTGRTVYFFFLAGAFFAAFFAAFFVAFFIELVLPKT